MLKEIPGTRHVYNNSSATGDVLLLSACSGRAIKHKDFGGPCSIEPKSAAVALLPGDRARVQRQDHTARKMDVVTVDASASSHELVTGAVARTDWGNGHDWDMESAPPTWVSEFKTETSCPRVFVVTQTCPRPVDLGLLKSITRSMYEQYAVFGPPPPANNRTWAIDMVSGAGPAKWAVWHKVWLLTRVDGTDHGLLFGGIVDAKSAATMAPAPEGTYIHVGYNAVWMHDGASTTTGQGLGEPPVPVPMGFVRVGPRNMNLPDILEAVQRARDGFAVYKPAPRLRVPEPPTPPASASAQTPVMTGTVTAMATDTNSDLPPSFFFWAGVWAIVLSAFTFRFIQTIRGPAVS